MREVLYTYIEEGRLPEVRFLLDRGVPPDADDGMYDNGNTPFLSAAWYGRVEILKLLAQRGADIHAQSTSGDAVMHVRYYNELETLRYLRSLGLGNNPDYSDTQGNYLLHYAHLAWRSSDVETREVLLGWALEQLRGGASMKFRSYSGESIPWLLIKLNDPALLEAARDRGLRISESE